MTEYKPKIASHCCVCGLELVDATSVEFGIGPVCRKKYSYEDALDIPEDKRLMVLTVLGAKEFPDGLVAKVSEAVMENDSRRAANLLVYYASAEQGWEAVKAAEVLRYVGYTALADRILDRLVPVHIVPAPGGQLAVRVPYKPEFTEAVRDIRGQRWDKENKVRMIPDNPAAKKALWGMLQVFYPGQAGVGPKGVFKVAAN